ncbi:hypothetical protein ACA758_00690 [Mycoplasmopsis agassizii]|uniref:hypothetical protein n=1 Tax=Mycoplasmopsis agassizii TaxID=33922 RepID=UPI0035280F98
MIETVVWVFFGLTFLFPLLAILASLKLFRNRAQKNNRMIEKRLKQFNILYITPFVNGKFSKSNNIAWAFTEIFLAISLSTIPLSYFSIAYVISLEFITDPNSIIIEKIIYGLTGLVTVIFWTIESVNTAKNYKINKKTIMENSKLLTKQKLVDLFKTISTIQLDIKSLGVKYRPLDIQNLRLAKSIFLKKDENMYDKYNFYFQAMNYAAQVILQTPLKNTSVSNKDYLSAYSKKMFYYIFEDEIKHWKIYLD